MSGAEDLQEGMPVVSRWAEDYGGEQEDVNGRVWMDLRETGRVKARDPRTVTERRSNLAEG